MVSELLWAAFPWVGEGGEVRKVGGVGLAQGAGGPAQRLLRARGSRGAARGCAGQQGWGRLREALTTSGEARGSRRRGSRSALDRFFRVFVLPQSQLSGNSGTAAVITPDAKYP